MNFVKHKIRHDELTGGHSDNQESIETIAQIKNPSSLAHQFQFWDAKLKNTISFTVKNVLASVTLKK